MIECDMAMPSSIPPLKPVSEITSAEMEHVPESNLQNIWRIMTTVKALLYYSLNFKEAESAELTPKEKQIIAMAADTAFPKNGSVTLSGTEAGIPEYVENYFRNMPPEKRRLLHMLFHFIECSPMIFGPRRRPFSTLNDAEKKQALDYCTKSVYTHRLSLQALRVLLTFGYLANKDVEKQIGCVPDRNPFGLE